jgi:hypothetical protein
MAAVEVVAAEVVKEIERLGLIRPQRGSGTSYDLVEHFLLSLLHLWSGICGMPWRPMASQVRRASEGRSSRFEEAAAKPAHLDGVLVLLLIAPGGRFATNPAAVLPETDEDSLVFLEAP